eukprot:g5218.t1
MGNAAIVFRRTILCEVCKSDLEGGDILVGPPRSPDGECARQQTLNQIGNGLTLALATAGSGEGGKGVNEGENENVTRNSDDVPVYIRKVPLRRKLTQACDDEGPLIPKELEEELDKEDEEREAKKEETQRREKSSETKVKESKTHDYDRNDRDGNPNATADEKKYPYSVRKKEASMTTLSPTLPSLSSGQMSTSASAWASSKTVPYVTINAAHTSDITHCAFSPRSDQLATCSNDTTIMIWNPATMKRIHVLEGHHGKVCMCKYSPAAASSSTRPSSSSSSINDILASVSYDASAILWDTQSGCVLFRLRGHRRRVWACDFTHDGTFLLTASGDNTLILWNCETGDIADTLEEHSSIVNSCACAPRGATQSSSSVATQGVVASGSFDKTVVLWHHDSTTGKVTSRQRLDGHASFVYSVAFTADGKTLASTSQDKSVRIWDVATGNVRNVLDTTHTREVILCAFSAATSNLALSTMITCSGADPKAVVWYPSKGRVRRILPIAEDAGAVLSCCVSGDGSMVAVGDSSGTVTTWTRCGDVGSTTTTTSSSLDGKVSSPSSSKISETEEDIRHDVVGSVCLHENGGPIRACAFSPDAQMFASCASDGTISLVSFSVSGGCDGAVLGSST